MEQSMVIDDIHESIPENDDLTTPSRAQKRLFLPSSSSSKRSLFREEREKKISLDNCSDAESDLGHMSPLALTDRSSCDSSPGRQFISPLPTPEKSPMIPLINWDHSMSDSKRNSSDKCISPFSSLRRVTRSARFSPRRVLAFSPKSKSSTSSQNTRAESNFTTPDPTDITIMPEELVPETPSKDSDFDDQQSYVAETPQKDEYSENRLITPLGSVYKNIPIPRIHRRKSLSALEFNECASPEVNKCSMKRHLDEPLSSNAKHQKTDELSSVPRARAALFQENNLSLHEKDKKLTLNPRSFYGASSVKQSKSMGLGWREPEPQTKKRKSLPSYSSTQRRSIKKHKNGEINCGVGHGIKRPKPKRQSLQNVTTKVEKQSNINNKSIDSKENVNPQTEKTNEKIEQISEEINPNKKFFKSKPGQNAVVTVIENVKLKVPSNKADIAHTKKRAKLDKIYFDDPAMEASLEQSKVDDILKILENDWADDDYDTMDTAQTTCLKMSTLSPKKSSFMLKDLTMSPASELSNMASTMNIKDIGMSAERNEKENIKENEISKKFYPLFSKGYSSNMANDDVNTKKRKRNNSWQLSKSGNCENQYQIDAGQKLFGATQCNECGVIYHIGDPDDENAHLNFHNSFKTLKFHGWKNERIVYKDSYTSSRIILVEPKDSNLYWKKVTEILEVVDRDLGLSDMKLSYYRDKKVYLYVKDKTILGVLVAEYVKNAFRMIPEITELNCCTSESTAVKCGVNVVWTAMSHRRQGIATKLVDTLRGNYYYGYIMSIDDIAFSIPTPSGKQFAEKYTKTKNFKVY